MRWMHMLQRLRPPRTDDDLKAAAMRETERLMAELERMDIRIEFATHRMIEELEQELRDAGSLQ
jgi:hypothetical protein